MSKKIASGSDAIVLDVKTGSGAFMQSVEDSLALAKEMVEIGTRAGKNVVALVTDMDQPLGMAIGNALEVKEAIEVLQNKQKGPLREVSIYLAAYMLYAAEACSQLDEGIRMIEEALDSGRGLAKLGEMIRNQGGDPRVIEELDLLPGADSIISMEADREGYVESIDTQQIGLCSMLLGAGRSKKEDPIDPGVGLVMKKRIGDRVNKGDILAEFYVNNREKFLEAVEVFKSAIKISENKPEPKPLVLGTVTKNGIKRTTG
jgi:pyrimidine-nucleoside phosphorylase